MDSNDPEQNLQSPLKNQDPEYDGEKKSKRPRTDDGGDEVQAFFTLVDKIQEMRKRFKKNRMNSSSAAEKSTSGHMDGNVFKPKSPWKPSFEWEDFPNFANIGSTGRDLTSSTISGLRTSAVSENSGIVSDKYKPMKSFDLNVEPSSEHTAPAAALTFFR